MTINPQGGSEWINVVVIKSDKCYFPSQDRIDNYVWPPFNVSSNKAHWPTHSSGNKDLRRVPHWARSIDFDYLTNIDWNTHELQVTCESGKGVTEYIRF